MKHRISYILLALAMLFPMPAAAQKWFKRVRKAQVNILAYDAAGQLLHTTNGVFVDDRGTVLTDYASLRGAARAVAIDEGGHEIPVMSVVGASSLYDVVSLRVDARKPAALNVAPTIPSQGETVYIMPYLGNRSGVATETTVVEAKIFDELYAYITMPVTLPERSTSVPVLNAEGQLLGLLQLSAQKDKEQSFCLSAPYAMSLRATAISATNSDYRDIHIRKQLPDDASQAASFIYLIGTRDTTLYLDYAADFIRQFPTEPTGYVMRGEMLTECGRLDEAEQAWHDGLDAKAPADELLYSRARSVYARLQTHSEQPDFWTLGHALEDARAAYDARPLPVYTALQGHILYALQRYDEACEHFLSVTHTNLRSADYFLYAAQCQQMKADTIAALELQDSAVACFTKPYMAEAAPSLLVRAQTLLSLNRFREAVADLNEYEHLKLDAVNANFYYQRAQAELQCRMFQQALSDLERAARMSPDDPVLRAELAAVNFRLNQVDDAIVVAREAIRLDPEFGDAHRILGVCLRAKGQKADADAALQRAADLGDQMAKQLLQK